MKKTRWLKLLLISGSLVVAGCEKKPSDDEQTQTKTTTASTHKAQQPNRGLIAKHVEASYSLPSCGGEGCPQVSIKRLDTSDPWINQFLDQRIQEVSNVQFSEEVAKTTSLQQNIDLFVQAAQKDSAERGAPVPYTMDIDTEYLGEHANIDLFEIEAGFYTGGAHGSSIKNYYNLNRKTHQHIKLNDIIIQGQKQKLHDLVYQQFIGWLKDNDPDVNIAQYETTWKFTLSENFTFGKDGLKLMYAQYEIAPFAAGMPEFTIPYAQLNGIVKPEYLK